MFNRRLKSVLSLLLALLTVSISQSRSFGAMPELSPVQRKLMMKAMAGSIKASPGEVAGSYDPTPVPVAVSKEDLRAEIEQMSSSIFFLRPASRKYIAIEMDAFVIPNGDYAEFDVTWKDLFDAAGKSVIREATVEEKAEFRREPWSRIYLHEKSKPVTAVGQMKIEAPTSFVRVTLGSGDVGKTRKVDGLSATLERCENDVASVSASGDFEKGPPVVVFYDEAGGRLKTSEEMTMKRSPNYSLACRASGKIAKVDVFMLSAYSSETVEVKATCKPVYYGEDAWNIRAPRYLPDRGICRFAEMDVEKIKRETRIVGRRGYAWYGFNTHRIVVHLPRVDNSCFVKAEITELELLDSTGAKVEHKLASGWFDFEGSYERFDISKTDDKDKSPVEYSRSVGKLKLSYPVRLRMVAVTVDNPKATELEARFEDSMIMIGGMGELKSKPFAPDRLAVVRGYDAQGHRLKKLNYSGYRTDRDGTKREKLAFWGTPVKLDVVVVDEWANLELPFDVPAAEKLPDSQRGHRPLDY